MNTTTTVLIVVAAVVVTGLVVYAVTRPSFTGQLPAPTDNAATVGRSIAEGITRITTTAIGAASGGGDDEVETASA